MDLIWTKTTQRTTLKKMSWASEGWKRQFRQCNLHFMQGMFGLYGWIWFVTDTIVCITHCTCFVSVSTVKYTWDVFWMTCLLTIQSSAQSTHTLKNKNFHRWGHFSPFLYTLFSSRFTLIINNKNFYGCSDPGDCGEAVRDLRLQEISVRPL
jgi:hypothetical protein